MSKFQGPGMSGRTVRLYYSVVEDDGGECACFDNLKDAQEHVWHCLEMGRCTYVLTRIEVSL